jgi:hypothetical protein
VSWNKFAYIFTPQVERALRYSIEEALRRQCRQAFGGRSVDIVEDAIETFKRKMEKNAPGATGDEALRFAAQMAANVGHIIVPAPNLGSAP